MKQRVNPHDPVKVISHHGTIAVVVGMVSLPSGADERAYGYILRPGNDSAGPPKPPYSYTKRRELECGTLAQNPEKFQVFDVDRAHWDIWQEPKPVPHWAALRWTANGGVSSSGVLYTDEESARTALKSNFIRLLKEWPAVEALPRPVAASLEEEDDE
jgi:hypothetical protein